ncbi:hypothetical protein [Luteibacter sp. 22Crub2.1]|uniref:hypothetical protein n=1 Tax=Luteibacter sp. 22Crub2.1 TaxID=1283288 RepID=UPI0009A85167|nr:hypothetical protein [Luteibacter sp. 22Crub2.1]
MLVLVAALAGALSGCTVPMGTLRHVSVAGIDGKAMPVPDVRSLHNVQGEWMRFDFDSDIDYARLVRRRELNVYVRLRWCGKGKAGRELTTARLFGDDGRVTASSRLAPVPARQPGSPIVFRYHTYVPVRVPKGPVMPPGSPEQGGDYDLRHPADDLCLSVGGGDMVGNHGESTLAVYPRNVLKSTLTP